MSVNHICTVMLNLVYVRVFADGSESVAWYGSICKPLSGWFICNNLMVYHSLHFQLSPAESRELNKECALLGFYDNHDIWHFLAAFAMFFSFLVSLYHLAIVHCYSSLLQFSVWKNLIQWNLSITDVHHWDHMECPD